MSETLKWVDADGVEHDLSDANGARVTKGVEGRFMPPVSFVEEEVPFQPGARLRRAKTLPREVSLPVLFSAADASALRTALRAWLADLNVDAGPGRLRVVAPGGDTRDLVCVYAGGMEIVETAATAGPTFQRAVVTFRAVDPYWQDATDVEALYELEAGAAFFPFFPLALGSDAFAEASIANTGDVDAWPRWTLTGPMSSPVVRNLTTGERLGLDLTLSAGDALVVDTRPGAKTVLQGDVSRYASLDTDSTFWPLVPGTNAIRVELDGATADTSVLLQYARRYLGA